MKLHTTLAALLLAAASSISFSAYAAAEADKTPAAKVQADTPTGTKAQPHMEEKAGMPQQKYSATAPEADKAKVAKAKADKARHLHPRDGK